MRHKGQLLDLKSLRESLNVTQKQLAESVKRPPSFISAIEHGNRSAPRALLDDLVRIYKIDNIEDYLSEPVQTNNGSVRNIKNSLVNSPGSIYSHPGDTRTISSYNDSVAQGIVEMAGYESPTTAQFLHLLMKSEGRLTEAQARIKELEDEVKRLRALLERPSNT